MSKLFFLDLETTGLFHWKNSIHQISGSIVIDGEIKERFNFNVRPHPKSVIEDAALAVSKKSYKEVQEYPPQNEVYSKIIDMLKKYVDKFDKNDKFHIVGYNNASFDNHFFRAFFLQNADTYFGSWFWSDSIDVMVLASLKLMNERSKMPNFKQSTVAKWLGIEIDESKLHDAEYDIDVCMQIFEKVK